MTNDIDPQLVALLGAVLDPASVPPPGALREAVLDAARRRRPAGRWWGAVEAIRPLDALGRANERLTRLLAELPEADWAVPARDEWTVKDLVAHLVGADSYTGAVLGLWPDPWPDRSRTHVEVTAPAIAGLASAAPDAVVRRWRRGVDDLAAHAAELARRHDEHTDFYGLPLTVGDVLVVRAFEVWAHTEEIAAAVHRSIEPPDPARLALMSDLATRLLPLGLRLTGQPSSPGAARLVLTGPGGGTWDVPLAGDSVGTPPDVVVVLDAVEFCRHAARGHLVADRLVAVEGDRSLVPALLAGAAAFAE